VTESWRISQLGSEALRNMVAMPLRAAITVSLFAAIFGGLAVTDFQVTEEVLNLRADLDAHGARVVIATGEGGLSAARCDALRGLAGVTAAGGVRLGDPVTLRSAPRLRFQSGAVTAGILEVWDPTFTGEYGAGFVVGGSFAEELAVTPGTVLVLSDSRLDRIGVVLNVKDRNRAVDRWLMEVVAPAGRISECWVEFSPGSLNVAVSLLGAWFEPQARQVVVRPLIPTGEFTRDPTRELAARPQAGAWLPLGLIVGLVTSLLTWLRRSEAGLYAALGVPATGLVLMAHIEATALIALSWVVGGAWAVALTEVLSGGVGIDQAIVALRSSASAALVGLLVTPVAVMPIVRARITDLLRDR
jgi:hypothetical protein